MKKVSISLIVTCLFAVTVYSQIKFSDETKKYIEYNDPVIIFQNALLIDGKGNAARPQQTVIIQQG